MENQKKEKSTEQSSTQHENCICCHKRLDIPVDLNIDLRPFYVEGAGQLCYECYHKIYK